MRDARSHRDWFEKDPAYHRVPREFRLAGTTGVTLVGVMQPPGAICARWRGRVLAQRLPHFGMRFARYYGGQRIHTKLANGSIGLAPADTPIGFENDSPVQATVALLPKQLVQTSARNAV